MERPEHPTRAYLAEFAWAILLVNLLAGLAGLLVGSHMGSIRLGLALFLGGSLTVTALLALTVALTVLRDAVLRAQARRARLRGGAAPGR